MSERRTYMLHHRLPLTPDASREAFLTIPQDITPAEAERLARIVLTLPLPDEQSKWCPNCGGDVLVPGSDHYIGGRWTCGNGRYALLDPNPEGEP